MGVCVRARAWLCMHAQVRVCVCARAQVCIRLIQLRSLLPVANISRLSAAYPKVLLQVFALSSPHPSLVLLIPLSFRPPPTALQIAACAIHASAIPWPPAKHTLHGTLLLHGEQ
jgi:hypothetical protein